MERKNRESYISRTISAFSPFGGERSELITRMRIMPYDTESKSRNADFISIARKGNPQPFEPFEPSEPSEPRAAVAAP